MFDVRGFGWVWVRLGHGSISSPGSGLGWVASVIWWVGLGWVDENRPMDNSALPYFFTLHYCYVLILDQIKSDRQQRMFKNGCQPLTESKALQKVLETFSEFDGLQNTQHQSR